MQTSHIFTGSCCLVNITRLPARVQDILAVEGVRSLHTSI